MENEPRNNQDQDMKMPEQVFTDTPAEPEPPSVSGALIVAIIIVLVVILGGLYLWSMSLNQSYDESPSVTRPTAEENNEPESTQAEAEVASQAAVSTSDELSPIEADLSATNLDSLDAELQIVEDEIRAGLGQ